MALKAPVGGEYKPVSEGTHLANCVAVYDLGTQPSEQFGPSHKILIQFELCDEEREFEGEKYLAKVSQTLTFSMNQKSNLRKLIESWAGKKFTDEQAAEFDVLKLAGKKALLSIVHKQSNGKTYPNISAVMGVPPGTTVPAPRAPIQTYEMGGPLPERLPEWLMLKITAAPEFVQDSTAEVGAGAGDEFANQF